MMVAQQQQQRRCVHQQDMKADRLKAVLLPGGISGFLGFSHPSRRGFPLMYSFQEVTSQTFQRHGPELLTGPMKLTRLSISRSISQPQSCNHGICTHNHRHICTPHPSTASPGLSLDPSTYWSLTKTPGISASSLGRRQV